MAAKGKQRADLMLVERGLAQSRSRAQALIMAGKVLADGVRVDKAGDVLSEGVTLSLKEQDHPWVSRGGQKLAHGLKAFDIDLAGAVVADIGASTGGFTDVALEAGAVRVYAVDVGHGQLDWGLRNDDRVTVMERTNARYLKAKNFDHPLDVVVCDASFISLKTVLPAVLSLVRRGGCLIALIKPQFEVGKGEVGKGGVVRSAEKRQAVVEDIRSWLADDLGWTVLGVTESPITGPKGNVEYLIGARRD